MRFRRAALLAIVPGVLAAGWVAATLSHLSAAEGNKPPALSEFTPTEPPQPVPDTAFTDGAGRTVTLADFRGRVILLNLWATWCDPCVREMPSLDRLQAAMGGKGFEVVLVSQDRGGAQTVDPFSAKLGMNSLKSYLDPKSALGQAFKVRGLPTSILIDRDGNEVGRLEGAETWDGARLQALLRWYVERGARKPPPDEPIKAAAN
jgi:thiol-disulfide isomerase/thioredoxin